MSEEKKKEPAKVSRRQFLKDAGIVVGGTAVGSSFLLTACGGETEVTKTATTTKPGTTVTTTVAGGTATLTQTQTLNKFVCPVDGREFDSLSDLQAHYAEEHTNENTSDLSTVSLHVNGNQCTLLVKPETILRDALRDQLGLTSIKDMCCGYGACGSCSVIMDGRPILSCMVLAIECDGVTIETSEALAENNHPLIDSYVLNHTMQCGYCTPGFIITSKALLDKNPNPSEEDIREILAGSICRCGTYPAHIRAVLEVAEKIKGA